MDLGSLKVRKFIILLVLTLLVMLSTQSCREVFSGEPISEVQFSVTAVDTNQIIVPGAEIKLTTSTGAVYDSISGPTGRVEFPVVQSARSIVYVYAAGEGARDTIITTEPENPDLDLGPQRISITLMVGVTGE